MSDSKIYSPLFQSKMESTVANILNKTSVYVYHTQFSLRLKVITLVLQSQK